ncbi:MAG: tail-specific protease [Gammaproteobacteria bacterium]|nr:tail-specific protease [Gammaproteobacteria bacterium]NCW08267.1 tail-specific protease [Gammaproteobacteria bacterium]NCW72996.1 tail-specific protease [Gammaproteobacteria bacterium]NCX48267.1 tail-specific protease [Gammaproteobacteria bacterium]
MRKFEIKGLVIAFTCVWMGSAYALSIEPTQEDSILAQMITRELERRHLASDALFAERKPMVGQLILKAIDPSRSLLTQDDIRQADIDRLPDQIERGRLNTVYQLYGLSLTRSEERLDYWLDILNQGVGSIDLSDQEELRIRDEETPWVSDLTSLKDLWRKQLENQAIGLLLADRTEDETYKALIRRYNSQKNRIEQTRPDDIFAGVINAYASAYDPHTSYLPPADSETFNINMSLSLQGIGAVLQSEDEFTKVVSLIPGGPAEMDGRLKPADRILSIAQGSQPFEDVVGWRLDEVVQKIRGPKGSQVRLEVQAGDDVPHREIVLIRDRVQLEEQSAKSQIIEAGKNGEKIGIITIPTFYSDFTAKQAGDPNYRSTTRDVKKLLEELRNQDVQGVIVDLRNNGGGSLQEAYELFGLFIPRGPVVQIRSAGGRTDVRGDRDPEVSWEGPMAVLVNRLSASASEIFAGAVQDYGRGLVIGSQTFGKGTVQALLPVNEGQLKLTIAKFYRISGQSTQHQGVIPDIQFPSAFDPKEIGESALDTALPWDQIRSLRYRPLDTPQARVAQLIDRHQARIATDPNFKALLKRTERALELSSETGISLHLATRIKEREDNNQALLDIENARRTGLGLPTIESISELESDGKEADPKDDASLMESARILLDEIQINPRLAGL